MQQTQEDVRDVLAVAHQRLGLDLQEGNVLVDGHTQGVELLVDLLSHSAEVAPQHSLTVHHGKLDEVAAAADHEPGLVVGRDVECLEEVVPEDLGGDRGLTGVDRHAHLVVSGNEVLHWDGGLELFEGKFGEEHAQAVHAVQDELDALGAGQGHLGADDVHSLAAEEELLVDLPAVFEAYLALAFILEVLSVLGFNGPLQGGELLLKLAQEVLAEQFEALV